MFKKFSAWLEDAPTHIDVETQTCNYPGCVEEGLYRAPKSPQQLRDWHWFCLEHVRQYNSSWNYYAKMSEDEIEKDWRSNITWQRPSWPLGDNRSRRHIVYTIQDTFDLLSEFAPQFQQRPSIPPPSLPEKKALALFDLQDFHSETELQSRYRTLVKRYHPDTNGGSKTCEEKLKEINQAYALLKNRLNGK